jgi:hypothetical protein
MILAHLISQLVLYFVQMKADSGINWWALKNLKLTKHCYIQVPVTQDLESNWIMKCKYSEFSLFYAWTRTCICFRNLYKTAASKSDIMFTCSTARSLAENKSI